MVATANNNSGTEVRVHLSRYHSEDVWSEVATAVESHQTHPPSSFLPCRQRFKNIERKSLGFQGIHSVTPKN